MAASLPSSATGDLVALAELVVRTGFVEAPREDRPSAESLWDFHEVLFHSRSSSPRLGERFAASHPHRRPEPPLVRPAFPQTVAIALPPPRLERWMQDDPPLARVIEQRRSVGMAGPKALALEQLGDFLHRTAHPHTDVHRALPSAGARHELEFYACVHQVEGLPSAFYHYHAQSHRLHALNAPGDAVVELLARAGAAWSTGDQIPHVVIVVSSRFPRMASRYASIAYRNTLLDAGIAIEAMYLNATAMQLAPCALGINLPDLFARMTGLDPFDETPVAMFALSVPNE
jgi:SagB-type dehydrogenase family enzyme